MRQKAWVKWRKRALAAERQLGATQRMFQDATGMDTTTWIMMKMAEMSAASPRGGVRITGIELPPVEERILLESPIYRKVFGSSNRHERRRTASATSTR